jgi:uncharacterized protein (DUF2236 family)
MIGLRRALERHVHQMVGFGSGEVDLDQGDAGLFGPDSAAWKVHADFTTMMVGGVAALLIQMLHPGALAGVWDHSDFRADMLGRLRRTAQFVSGTTYGSTGQAERLIARVRAIHDHVRGMLPDGSPYSANDPALLTWVHVAEVSSFLAAYLRYRDPRFPMAEQDRYFAETARIAERLGARDVPTSAASVAAYFDAVRSQLRADERTRTVAQALMSQSPGHPALAPFGQVLLKGGAELLPEWAAQMHGINRASPIPIRTGVKGIGHVMRWALRDSSAKRARRRVARNQAEQNQSRSR